MTSRPRKEQQNFNLQAGALTLEGHPAVSAADGTEPPHDAAQARTGSAANVSQAGSLGKIEVSPRAIAHVASRATQASYGVVGLASRNARPGWAELLRREEEHKGVEVSFSDGRVVIDLYVIIEYGTRISEVARNIMSNTKFALQSALGVPVVQVNVNVQGIRVSK